MDVDVCALVVAAVAFVVELASLAVALIRREP